MTLQKIQKNIIIKLSKEGVLSKPLEEKILSIKSVSQIQNLAKKIVSKKKNLLKIVENLKTKNISLWFDTKLILQNLDGKGYKNVVKKASEMVSFLNRKQTTIHVAQKNKFPKRIITELEKSKDRVQLEKILDEIPPILLIKVGLKKLKTSSQISSGKSIRTIPTPMRN